MATKKHKPTDGIKFERKPEVPLARFFITFDVRKDEAGLDADFCKRLYEDRSLATAFLEDARDLLSAFEATYEKHYRGKRETWGKKVTQAAAKKPTPAKTNKATKAAKPPKGKARK